MDFTLSEELKVFQSGIRDFVKKNVTREYIRECDNEAKFPKKIWDEMVKAGYMGLIVPEESHRFCALYPLIAMPV